MLVWRQKTTPIWQVEISSWTGKTLLNTWNIYDFVLLLFLKLKTENKVYVIISAQAKWKSRKFKRKEKKKKRKKTSFPWFTGDVAQTGGLHRRCEQSVRGSVGRDACWVVTHAGWRGVYQSAVWSQTCCTCCFKNNDVIKTFRLYYDFEIFLTFIRHMSRFNHERLSRTQSDKTLHVVLF